MKIRPFSEQIAGDEKAESTLKLVGTITSEGFVVQVGELTVSVPTAVAAVDELGPFADVIEGDVPLPSGFSLKIVENEALPDDPPNGMWQHQLAIKQGNVGLFSIFFDHDGNAIGAMRVRQVEDDEWEEGEVEEETDL